MLTKAETNKLLNTLAELGGKAFKEEDIVYEGNKLVIPEQFRGRLGKAIDFLTTKVEEEEAVAAFQKKYPYRPWDGAYCAFQALKKAFGLVQGKPIQSFFGDRPPAYITVATGIDTSEEVPWGKFAMPLLENTFFFFGGQNDEELGHVFHLYVESPRKNRFVIEGIFKLVEEELAAHSIYRGKAIDGKSQPNFLDLSGTRPEQVIYAEQVRKDLEANVWGFMEHIDKLMAMGESSKRSILLSGPYGTGKTLTANLTALRAVAAGWTFILARPGRDLFFEVIQTAKLYQPAVVFMEDADTIAHEDGNDHISELLDVFDGIQAKSTKLMVVLTTNHKDKLTSGMRRPGRIDQLIHIGALDDKGMEALVRMVLGGKCDKDMDFVRVCQSCKDYSPAFIKEAASRAIRYAMVRTGGEVENAVITTEDMVYSANSLREHFEWNREKVTVEDTDDLSKAVRSQVAKAIGTIAIRHDELSEETPVWNPEALEEIQRSLNGHNN